MKRYFKVIPKDKQPSSEGSSSTSCTPQPRLQVQTRFAIGRYDERVKTDRVYLKAALGVVKYLIRTGVAWNIPEDLPEGDLFETLEFLGQNSSETARIVMKNAQENNQLSLPDIQQDLVSVCASETIREIVKEIGDDIFSVVVDDCGDEDHMTVVVRFVDGKGFVVERYIGIVHDESSSLDKVVLETMLSRHGLSISKIRGIGYYSASKMRDRFNGLRNSIQKENPSAYYVHCFADRLHLILIAAVECNLLTWHFGAVSRMVKLMSTYYKCEDMLLKNQATEFADLIRKEIIETTEGFKRFAHEKVGDTRWADILFSLVKLFPHLIAVLEELENVDNRDIRFEANSLLDLVETFDFMFILHLMVHVLRVTYDLNEALYSQDQNLINALELFSINKKQLLEFRDDGWEAFLNEVVSVCNKWDIDVPDMNAQYSKGWRRNREGPCILNLQHYKVDCFYEILNIQLKELNDRFNDENELLNCVGCLSPCLSFERFDKKSLLRMTEFYPHEFCGVDVTELANQFECYITDVRSDVRFSGLQGIADLCRKLYQTKKHKTYHWVYMLLRLALVLPITASNGGRVFSASGIVQRQRGKMKFDEYMDDCLVTFIEMDLFDTIGDEVLLDRFQSMESI